MPTSLTSPQLTFATDKAIVASRKALARVVYFATDFSSEAVQPGTTMKVPVFKHGVASEFNEKTNNYETIDGSVLYPEVTFDHHVKHTFGFTDKDFMEVNGSNFWSKAGEASGVAISKAIASSVSALINKTKIPKSATNESVFASVTKETVAKLRDTCSKADIDPGETVLMLTPTLFAALLATLDANAYGGPEAIRHGVVEGLYGFKAVIENSDLSTSADEKLNGALIPTDALVVASRLVPVKSPSVYEEIGTTQDEVSGLVLGARRHGSPATGSNYATHEIVFGAALAQAEKCVRLVSAATA